MVTHLISYILSHLCILKCIYNILKFKFLISSGAEESDMINFLD